MLCRVCGGNNFSVAIDLHDQPLGNHFLKQEEIGREPFYPLKVVYCHDCCCAQLDCTVKKEIVYSDRNTYLSGITRSLKDHFTNIAKQVDDNFFKDKKDKLILDIGSNDGTQLQCYKDLGYEVIGVEASEEISRIANERGVFTIPTFFNLEEAKKINRYFDVINAAGVFFHLEELHSVTEAIKAYLKKDGVFVVQCMYMKKIMENVAFDQIYHEHLLYYTLKTLNTLLKRHGLALFDAFISPIHGGSIMGFVSHIGQRAESARLKQLMEEESKSKCNELSSYVEFAKSISKLKKDNLAFLKKCQKAGKKVYGMGAPVKGNTLLNYFGIGPDLISHLVEKNELRRGLFSPGKHIPILIEKELTSPPDVYYVLAWNFKKEILKNNQALIDRGVEFYFPINPKEDV
jgi:SAM-dependent methyltransferase